MALPKTLGACADKLYRLREQRQDAQKVVDKLKSQETELKVHLINTLPKSDLQGAIGKKARVKITTKDVGNIKDWDKFCKYMSKNKAWDLVQRRVSAKALKDRWDEGKKIPGVEPFRVVDVSLTKVPS